MMVDREDRKRSIEKYGKTAQGRQELLRHVEGERLTLRQMILAKCYECMAYYGDGKIDCKIPLCPLYPMMPFRKGEKYRVKSYAGEGKALRASQAKDLRATALADVTNAKPAKNSAKAIPTHPPKKRKKAAKK